MSEKVNKIVTEKMIKLLEDGVIPWQRPWKSGRPQNFITKRPYRGINALITSPIVSGFECQDWLTAKQLNTLGFKLKENQKYTPIVFWGRGEKKVNGKDKKFAFTRFYKIFNKSQIENYETTWPPEEPIKPCGLCDECDGGNRCRELPDLEAYENEAQDIMDGYESRGGSLTSYGKGRAYYCPATDKIGMPSPGTFVNRPEFWSTQFHEVIHSTGHKNRLSRNLENVFGDHAYSEEELVAEMGSCFLMADLGIIDRTIVNSAGYIQSWLKKLKDNRKFLMQAAQRAEKACDYVRGESYNDKQT